MKLFNSPFTIITVIIGASIGALIGSCNLNPTSGKLAIKPSIASRTTISVPEQSDTIITNLEYPELKIGETITKHYAYSLSYNEQHEQANWIAYQYTRAETVKHIERKDKFIIDPHIPTGSADANDYKNSGYDRGHLAPAADMLFDQRAMEESFYFSNMSPQIHAFNNGIWKKLEKQVRDWAEQYDTIYVVTGPVLTPGLPTIGHNKVSVPEYYYKVILKYSPPDIRGIGFIVPVNATNKNLKTYAVSIDSVENFTNINFYYLLIDQVEQKTESNFKPSLWKW
ncbi:MAG TPA: DNA/RNA non-specific endonuclease [Bacteroidales bacterium]|nr:DNA/RNA non-specific endonuclease [Bacteroidales bacterium]